MKLIYHVKPPCFKCPYKLGQIHTMANPCSQCKANGYKSFEQFKKEQTGSQRLSRKGEEKTLGLQDITQI